MVPVTNGIILRLIKADITFTGTLFQMFNAYCKIPIIDWTDLFPQEWSFTQTVNDDIVKNEDTSHRYVKQF